jgi:preprotein translocase subunit SecG
MTEKIYWGFAVALVAGLIFLGTRYHFVLTGLHILVCLFLLLVVLLQSGRAADLAGAFGGAGSQTAFGPRGAATLLSKATTFLAVVFMATSLLLALYASRGPTGSVLTPAEPAPGAATEQTSEPAAPPAEQPAEPSGGQSPSSPPSEP